MNSDVQYYNFSGGCDRITNYRRKTLRTQKKRTDFLWRCFKRVMMNVKRHSCRFTKLYRCSYRRNAPNFPELGIFRTVFSESKRIFNGNRIYSSYQMYGVHPASFFLGLEISGASKNYLKTFQRAMLNWFSLICRGAHWKNSDSKSSYASCKETFYRVSIFIRRSPYFSKD